MTTEKQIATNRRNAQLSTGPKTPEGKSRSRLNAFKHGMNAKGVVIPAGLSLEAFQGLLASLLAAKESIGDRRTSGETLDY